MGPLLPSVLKSLLTAELEDHAKVETQEVSTLMLRRLVSQIHLASNTLHLMVNVTPRLDVKTAPGHHALRVKTAKTSAGLSSIRTTLSRTTIASEVPTR